jgi:hypothetical protein
VCRVSIPAPEGRGGRVQNAGGGLPLVAVLLAKPASGLRGCASFACIASGTVAGWCTAEETCGTRCLLSDHAREQALRRGKANQWNLHVIKSLSDKGLYAPRGGPKTGPRNDRNLAGLASKSATLSPGFLESESGMSGGRSPTSGACFFLRF